MTDTPAKRISPCPSRRQRLVVLAVVLGVVVTVGVLVMYFHRAGPGRSVAAPDATGQARATAVGSTSPGTASPHWPARPARTTRTPPHKMAHQFVASAAPTEFLLKGPKFLIKAAVCGMDNIRPLDPPGEQHHTVCWVQQGFGVAPGSRSATTYILGHSWGQDSSEVLNKLSEVATPEILAGRPRDIRGVPTFPVTALNGYVLTLQTPKGILRYTVRDTYGVAKSSAADVGPLMNERTRNRVVVITCAELPGTDYDYNVIVDAYLTSSTAVRPE